MNINFNSEQKSYLQKLLLSFLEQHPDGISEYALLKQLIDSDNDLFDSQLWDNSLHMFRSHFILFNVLYQLRDSLRSEKRADLEIHCLNIKIKKWQNRKEKHPDKPDPLRDYYLDLNNLVQTTDQDVEKLLTDFWNYLATFENRDDALSILGLQKPSTQNEIKSRYRSLVKKHHPDHGGDPARFREIKEAAKFLLG